MNRHKMNRNPFRLGNGDVVSIEYWNGPDKVRVAAYDADGHQVSRATFEATVDGADVLDEMLRESLVKSLANALEYELTNNPDAHLRKH